MGADKPPSLDRGTASRIARAVERDMRRQMLPGLIVGIARDGHRPWTIARGHASLYPLRPMRTDEHVRMIDELQKKKDQELLGH